MTRPMVRIHNSETDEIIDREMDNTEFAAYEKSIADSQAAEKAEAQAATDKAALLAKMGLTADEAKLLLSQEIKWDQYSLM